MTVKEKIKQEVDKLPDNVAEKILNYINSIKRQKKNREKIPSLNLKGQYDNIHIRHHAYE